PMPFRSNGVPVIRKYSVRNGIRCDSLTRSIAPVRPRIQGPEARVLRHLEAERVAKKRHHFLTSNLMHLHVSAPGNRVRQVPQDMSRVVDDALRREVEHERTPRVRTRKPVSYL